MVAAAAPQRHIDGRRLLAKLFPRYCLASWAECSVQSITSHVHGSHTGTCCPAEHVVAVLRLPARLSSGWCCCRSWPIRKHVHCISNLWQAWSRPQRSLCCNASWTSSSGALRPPRRSARVACAGARAPGLPCALHAVPCSTPMPLFAPPLHAPQLGRQQMDCAQAVGRLVCRTPRPASVLHARRHIAHGRGREGELIPTSVPLSAGSNSSYGRLHRVGASPDLPAAPARPQRPLPA